MYEEKAKVIPQTIDLKGLQLFEWVRYLFLQQSRNLAPMAVLK
jgi:hypothetical protein